MLPGKKYSAADVLPALKRRIWLLILPPAIGLFLGLVISARLPNIYQSDMLIAIIPQRVPDTFVRSTVTLKTETRLDTITTQVKSRTSIEQLIRELDLYQDELLRLPMEDVVGLMNNNIKVELAPQRRGPYGPEPPHAFYVRFLYPDPQVAARVTQRLGSLFVDQNARDRGALADQTNQFLETQLAQSRVRLEAIERRLEAFRERHGSELPTQMQSNLQVMQSTQLQIQALIEAIARDRDRKMMLERLYNEAQAEPAMVASPQIQAARPNEAPPVTGTPEQQLAATRATLAALEQRLKPEHPDVRRARRRLTELEALVKETPPPTAETPAATTVVTNEEMVRRQRLRDMRAEIESLDRQTQFKDSEERRLRGIVGEYQRRVEAVPGLESEWVQLTRDYDTQQQAYRELRAKAEQSKVAVDLEKEQIGEQFRILDPAVVPTRPISPVRFQVNGIAFALGLFLGVGLAALLEVKDASFRTEKDVLDTLLLPVLAVVPLVETASERRRRLNVIRLVAAVGVVVVAAAAWVFWSMRLWNYVV